MHLHFFVAWLSVCVCVEPIEVPFGIWTQMGARNHVLGEGPDLPRGGAVLGAKYREYLVCSQYSQPYSVGGSSNVSFLCHYCNSLLYCRY